MSRKHPALSVLTSLIVACTFAVTASAEKGGHGKGGGKAAKHGAAKGSSKRVDKGGGQRKGSGGNAAEHAGGGSKGKGHKFESSQRGAIESYYRDNFTRDCPPGLAKKNNGCLPPGQARSWSVGQSLPTDVVFMPLPGTLRTTLAPPLPGYDYGYVDGYVILYSPHERVVVDFVAVF